MKKRFKNLVTSIFGLVILLIDIIFIIVSLFFNKETVVTWQHVLIWLLIGLIGYIFLRAEDKLLEGLTFKLLKIKEKE